MSYEYQAILELDEALRVDTDDAESMVRLYSRGPYESNVAMRSTLEYYSKSVLRPRLFALVARLAGIPTEETTDHVATFRAIAALVGPAFDGVDPDQLVAEMRYDSPFSEDQIRAMLRHASIHPRERFGDAGERGR